MSNIMAIGRAKDILVDSFNELDYKWIILPLIAVYKNPKDYPEKFVARLWNTNKPTNAVIVGDTLEDVRQGIPSSMFNIGRLPKDDPTIVEVWV